MRIQRRTSGGQAIRHFQMARMWMFVAVSTLVYLFCSTQDLYAQQGSIAASVPLSRTSWSTTLEFPQFDPTQGILQRVRVTIDGQIRGESYFENTSPTTSTVSFVHEGELLIAYEDGSEIATMLPVASSAQVVPGYDGFGAFAEITEPITSEEQLIARLGGTSGGLQVAEETEQSTLIIDSASQLQRFIGTGAVPLLASADATARQAEDTGNVDKVFRSFAALTVTLTYEFARPAVILSKYTNGADANDPFGNDVPKLLPGAPLTWTYLVTNSGNISIPLASVVVTDSHAGVTPQWIASSDTANDQILSPGETWRYEAYGTVEALQQPAVGITVVPGCSSTPSAPETRNTYVNIGTVTIPGSSAQDVSHYCNPRPAIQLLKTVYLGHSQGAGCPGLDFAEGPSEGAAATYCFLVINTGETYLNSIVISDALISITEQQMTLISGRVPLAPNATLSYYYETTIDGALDNIAAVEGNPSDSSGNDLPGLPNVTDEDPAIVRLKPFGLGEEEEPSASQKVFLPFVNR